MDYGRVADGSAGLHDSFIAFVNVSTAAARLSYPGGKKV